MASRKRASPARVRVGRVSLYLHHGGWWVYYRDSGQPVRRKVAPTREEGLQVASQVNAQLTTGAPTLLSFTPITVPQLRQEFLHYHEHILRSAVGTVRRYRAATQHLENFAQALPKPPMAHELRADPFAAYLRALEVTPNGHPNTNRRPLRDKGVQFVMEAVRAMYTFAGRRRHLPPYGTNPFAELPLGRLVIEDAKPIFVFDADSELAYLRAADAWSFPLNLTLAKTGLRVGELVHLLIEEVDLDGGWLRVHNKAALGWSVKTRSERAVPLLPEVIAVLRVVIGGRKEGPVFLRKRFANGALPPLLGDRRELERVCEDRQRAVGKSLARAELLRIARTVWRDAGAVKADAIRTSFIRIARAIGHPEATCPKSWRHTFATLLGEAMVDPLIRQMVMGHKPTTDSGLGMTTIYTHPRLETQRQQIEQALRRWPQSLALAHALALQAEQRQATSPEIGGDPAHKEVQ